MKRTVIICAVILLAAAGLAALTFVTEPSATRGGATKQTAMLVQVTGVERGTYRPAIVATGVVEAEQDIVLRPQVTGEVVKVSPAFAPGGFVDEGDALVRIEAADYRNALQQRKSELSQALADLEIEMGRQSVAKEDYELFGKKLPDEKKQLVLRKPQLDAAQTRVEAARAAVNQAQLDLRRTTIEAPFNAHILRRDVNVGSRVSPNDSLGRLVGVDTYWVALTVPMAKLQWITLPEGDSAGAEVQVRNRSTWPKGARRTGHVDKLIGALEQQTRMARVLVTISDPLAREPDNAGAPRLIVGEFLEATIQGTPLDDVIRLDRAYLRDDDTVWVMEGDVLRIRDVDVVMTDAEHAYVAGGLNDDDQIVTTNLSTVTDGARLRVKSPQEAPAP